MNSTVHPRTLLESARAHWRSYLPMWLLPVTVMFAFIAFIIADGNPLPTFIILGFVVVPFGVFATRRASGPVLTGALGQVQHFLLAIVAPLAVWCALISGFFVVGLAVVALR